MTGFIAALPMYEWPETRAETDAEWARLAAALRAHGIDAPARIVRRNADMPPVPGGIRDASGKVIAADPATLPPDELDFHALWLHPQLLFTQTCWGPMELGLARHVQVIGQPSYDAFEGGQGELYSSALVMRRGLPSPLRGGSASGRNEVTIERRGGGKLPLTPTPDLRSDPPLKGEGGAAKLPLHLLRGKRFAYNSLDSMSGIIALTRDLGAAGESLDIFSEKIESGGHRSSIVAVAEGRADIAAIDCRSFALAQRFEPAAAEVHVVGWTAQRKGLPYITARTTPEALVAKLRAAVASLVETEALVG